MRRLRYAVVGIVLVLLALPLGAGEDACKIKVSGWSYSRSRKTVTSSNRVIGTFQVKNVSDAAMKNVAVTLVYVTGLGEKVGAPARKDVGALKPGEAQTLSLTSDFIPAFSGYTVTVEFAGGKEEWFANSDTGQPQFKSAGPLEGAASVVLLGRDVQHDKSGRFAGSVRVKNEGTVEAKNVKITISFFDTSKRKMREWSDKLGKGTLDARAEANIPFVCPVAPRNYGGYEIKVGCDDTPAEQALGGGDFTNAAEVEVAKFNFSRAEPKSPDLKVTAQIRNGLSTAVDDVKVVVTFLGPKKKELKKHTFELPGQLPAGEVKPIEFVVAGVPAYEAFEPAIGYKTAGTAPQKPAAGSGQIALAKFKNTPEIEIIFTDVVANDDKSVAMAGAMRNGKAVPVKDVAITAVFVKADGTHLATGEKTITDVVRPGEERNFVMRAQNAAGFASYTFRFKFVETEEK